MTTATTKCLEGALPLSRSLRAHLITERARKRFSQAELAKRSGVARYTIVRLESGEETNPRLDVLVRIAGALEVPVHSLLEPIAPPAEASDAELRRRMRTPRSEFIDMETLLKALDEADAGIRYSKRGRRRVERHRSPESQQGPKRVSSDES